ncbi:tetrathionate reductase [Photobacterium frigidiphilum]|uniref:Tetrathionate reductase n=1 Tax=Photobacterium frigidiphilum TaxID=264736 RepID=A0A2T3JIR7_9GAMM|nr:NrfD/PsrC family molybdoenzyme membrane anchor subunit [Photobacterium frigidiphilum]PSU48875.1 tetrathionate reductase [Photobacterium frigidiphilum]
MNITEILVPPQDIAWLPWAVQYFFYIGSAYAAAILFCIACVFKHHTSHVLRAALALVLAISAVVGPLALTADLHQPGRAWHFFTHLTSWSWMSNGSLFLPIFSILAVLAAWLYLRPDIQQLENSPYRIVKLASKLTLGNWTVSSNVFISLTVLTALSGLTIALYTGAEIAILQSRPLWHQLASPLLWFVTAFLGAISLTGIMLLLTTEPSLTAKPALTNGDNILLKRTTLLSAILALILLPLWVVNSNSLALLNDPQWVTRLTVLTFLFVCCIAVHFTALSTSKVGLVITSAITLISCWYLRWVTIMDVQTIPRYDAGTYPYELPMGPAGLLGIIAMAGLWIALAAVLSEVVHQAKTSRTLSSSSVAPSAHHVL